MDDAMTCFSFFGTTDLGPSNDYAPDATPDACGAKGCYSDRLCAECRLKRGDACEACGAPGEVVDEDVLCRKCAAEDGGRWIRFTRLGDPTALLGRNPGAWSCTFGNATPAECGKPAAFGRGDSEGACPEHAVAMGVA